MILENIKKKKEKNQKIISTVYNNMEVKTKDAYNEGNITMKVTITLRQKLMKLTFTVVRVSARVSVV
jgi:deoxycytidylate deaminase